MDFHENQGFWHFQGLVARKDKHVSKMFLDETLSFTSTNNFLGGIFHETQYLISSKSRPAKMVP